MLMKPGDSFHDVLRFYSNAEPEIRVTYILNNFSVFPELADQIEKSILYQIHEEYRYNKRTDHADPGVRIQKSFTSDPTADEAIVNIELETAFRSGRLSNALRFTDEPERHCWEHDVIEEMRRDFSLVRGQISLMRRKDRKLLLIFLEEGASHMDIAEEHHIQYESAKVKISRLKRQVRERAAACILEQHAAGQFHRKNSRQAGRQDDKSGCSREKARMIFPVLAEAA